MQSIWLSPHDDDNVLFGSFTCLREKPLVVICFDSWVQPIRGEIGCDAETRAKETEEACKILGCSVLRLSIRDDIANAWMVRDKLSKFQNFEKVYIPALQGGHHQHDLVNKVAHKLFTNLVEYTTYTPTELYTQGNIEIKPTAEELDLKNRALACYVSQINLASTMPHFEAVRGRSEWIV